MNAKRDITIFITDNGVLIADSEGVINTFHINDRASAESKIRYLDTPESKLTIKILGTNVIKYLHNIDCFSNYNKYINTVEYIASRFPNITGKTINNEYELFEVAMLFPPEDLTHSVW